MSYTFTVNGAIRTVEENKPLLRYLRDDLKLYSVKDGCSEGACGTCTIVVDGRAVKSCVLTTERADGKNILTVEGLSVREKEAFVFAFGSCGSVQCGFCIPGMVMAAKALIDRNPSPTDQEIKEAIRGNVCRCTGYKKIVMGIRRAAALLRGDEEIKFVSQFSDEDAEGEIEYISEFGTPYDPAIVSGIANYRNYAHASIYGTKVDPEQISGLASDTGHGRASIYGVGQNVFRIDVRKKVLGYGKYPDDIGPEYFVPSDRPELIMELAGWSREDLDAAIERGEIKPGANIHRKGEHGCNACTIVDPDMPPMAYVSAVRSQYPRAVVKKIHKEKAEEERRRILLLPYREQEKFTTRFSGYLSDIRIKEWDIVE